MTKSVWIVIAAAGTLTALCTISAPSLAQTADETKEKPPLYTYESYWTIPRARWGEVAKDNATGTQKILAPALADGTLVGYGADETLVHTPEGFTHDNWWQAHSMAGLMKVLDAFYKSGTSASPVLVSSTKHWDQVLVSRHYNWKPGSWKGAFGHGSTYKLKPDAPNDAVATLSKSVFVPLLEKLLADGTLVEYEIDEETIHTASPDQFIIYYLTPTAEGLDKVNAAIRAAVKENSLIGPALGSMIDYTPHRDDLVRADATYK
jgi:hypothetical protein